MVKAWLVQKASVAIGAAMLCGLALSAGGCLLGFKPASETVLTIRSAADPGSQTKPITFGMADVYWDQLDHGYGVAGTSYHPRDHEAYFYFGYDPDQNGHNEFRTMLISPLGSAGQDGKTYQLEMRVRSPQVTSNPAAGLAGEWRLAVPIGPPVRKGDTIRFDLKNVPVWGPGPERAVLSGRVVARKAYSTEDFENALSRWNDGQRREAAR